MSNMHTYLKARHDKETAAASASSTEDLDAGAVGQGPRPVTVIEPQPSNLKELNDTYERLEAEADDTARTEAADTHNAMTAVRDDLDSANATGGISAESACFAAMAIESYSRYLGVESRSMTPALEAAIDNVEGKTVVATEALTASLEGVDKPLKEWFKRGASTFYRLLVPSWSMVKFAGVGLDGIIDAAKKAKPQSGATIKVQAKRIALGAGVSKNVAADLQAAATKINFLIRDFGSAAKADYKANLDASHKFFVKVEESSDVIPAMEQIFSSWHDPRKKLGGNPSEPIIGNIRFFEDQSLKYDGKVEVAKKFDELANHAYPTLIGFQKDADNEVDNDRSGVEIPALTPDQIAKIGLTLKTAVKNYGFWASMWEKTKASATTPALLGLVGWSVWAATVLVKLINRSGQFERKPGEHFLANDVRTVYDALVTSHRLCFHVPYDASKALRATIKLYKKLAKESLRATVNAATEAFDQQTSVDGVSVNETAANEPEQTPAKDNLAPAGEVIPKQASVQDLAAAKQDLTGPVDAAKAKTEAEQIQKDQEGGHPVEPPKGGYGMESRAESVKHPYWYRKA